MTIEEIRALDLDGVERRMNEISTEMNAADADLDALTAEVDALTERRAALQSQIERRNALAARVAFGQTGTQVRNFQPAAAQDEEARYGRSSALYRTAWLKNIAVRSNGQRVFGDLTEEEQRAFTHTTTNTSALVPTSTLNRIVDLVTGDSPIDDDADDQGQSRGFAVPRHTAIAAGDATGVSEGTENNDEQDTFDLLGFDGVEIKKHVVVSRKLMFKSIDAFEDWLVKHLGKRIKVAKENVCIARLRNAAPAGGSAVANSGMKAANILTGQTYSDATIRSMFALLKGTGEPVVYANQATIWNQLAGIEDGNHNKLFTPNSMVDPVTQGRIYGAVVKKDDQLADNVVFLIRKGQLLKNEFDDLEIFTAIEPKTANTIITGYSLYDAALENPEAAVQATFTVSSGSGSGSGTT